MSDEPPKNENTPDAPADDPVIRIDWSTEPTGVHANVVNVARFQDVFAVTFAESIPSPDRILMGKDGKRFFRATVGAAVRLTAVNMLALITGLAAQWNQFAAEHAPEAPKFKLLNVLPENQLAGLTDEERK